jgi:hypothetical protein
MSKKSGISSVVIAIVVSALVAARATYRPSKLTARNEN